MENENQCSKNDSDLPSNKTNESLDGLDAYGIRRKLKWIGFIGIIFFLLIIVNVVTQYFILFPLSQGGFIKIFPWILGLVAFVPGIGMFIGGIGLTQHKQWARITFVISIIIVAILLGMGLLYIIGLGLFLSMWMTSFPMVLLLIIQFLPYALPLVFFLVMFIVMARYLGAEKVRKVCK